MHAAKLGDILGAAVVRSRSTNDRTRQHQGTFAFRAMHAQAVMELYESGKRIELVGVIDGEPGKLPVVLTHVAIDVGMVFFSGSGEPRREREPSVGDVGSA